MAKSPEKVNLGGLWLLNPHAPRATQTNLKGTGLIQTAQVHRGEDHAGRAHVLPTAWILDVPLNTIILTGSGIEPEGTDFELLTGTHILQQQRYDAFPFDSTHHPFHQRFAVWYQSLQYYVQANEGELPYNRHCWTLYYGNRLPALGRLDTVIAGPSTKRWWLVAGLGIDNNFTDPDKEFLAFSDWMFSHPLADPGRPLVSTDDDATERFNPLGANVFRRNQGIGTSLLDSLTIRPYYG